MIPIVLDLSDKSSAIHRLRQGLSDGTFASGFFAAAPCTNRLPAPIDLGVHDAGSWDTLLEMNEVERALIERAQRGDVDAFSRLVEEHWHRLVSFTRSVVGANEAEDLVQEGLVSAWENLSALRDPGAFSAWVLRIVARRCFRRVRTVRHLVPLELLPEPSDPAGSDRFESIDVERMLSILPSRQRAVMHLTVVEGMSDSEIGGSLHIAAASVRSHRRRARDTLHRIMGSVKVHNGGAS